MTAIGLRAVTKVFPGGVRALDEITGEFKQGEFAVLVGPSGSGKTTLLRLIAGLEQPNCGQVFLGGREANRWPPHRRGVAMVFQRAALYPHLTVLENLRWGLPRRLLGSRPAEVQRAEQRGSGDRGGGQAVRSWDELAVSKTLGIERLLQRYPDQLSGGQQQRVAVARALIRRPAVLLLDEPFVHLDPSARQAARRWLAELHEQFPVTTVLVTHDPAEALMLGQRLLVMRQGRLQQCGPPRHVYWQPANRFVAQFFGDPPMNLIAGRLTRLAGGVEFRGGGLRLELSEGQWQPWHAAGTLAQLRSAETMEVVLGIRPEHVDWSTGNSGLPACVERVEWRGVRSTVYVRTLVETEPSATLALVAPGDCAVQLGSKIFLGLGSDRLYFFGAKNGQNLVPPSPAA